MAAVECDARVFEQRIAWTFFVSDNSQGKALKQPPPFLRGWMGNYKGEKHHASKLTQVEVNYIRKLRGEGLSYRKIAEAINNIVSPFTVRDVVKGYTWLDNKG